MTVPENGTVSGRTPVSPYLSGSVTESPVGLVLSEHAGKRNAMTVSFFSEVSHHPTSLWVSIAKSSLTHAMIIASGQFSLIVLHERQATIAVLCGAVSGRSADKCSSLPLSVKDGWLFLDGALASIACTVMSMRDLGDHTLFLAAIISGELDSRNSMRRHLLTLDLMRA